VQDLANVNTSLFRKDTSGPSVKFPLSVGTTIAARCKQDVPKTHRG
jgi:hypothetical protein